EGGVHVEDLAFERQDPVGADEALERAATVLLVVPAAEAARAVLVRAARHPAARLGGRRGGDRALGGGGRRGVELLEAGFEGADPVGGGLGRRGGRGGALQRATRRRLGLLRGLLQLHELRRGGLDR